MTFRTRRSSRTGHEGLGIARSVCPSEDGREVSLHVAQKKRHALREKINLACQYSRVTSRLPTALPKRREVHETANIVFDAVLLRTLNGLGNCLICPALALRWDCHRRNLSFGKAGTDDRQQLLVIRYDAAGHSVPHSHSC